MEMVLRLPSSYVDVEKDEMEYVDGGGFVGIHVNVANWVYQLGGVAAGGYVSGVVAMKLKILQKGNAYAWGIYFACIAVSAAVVGWAVNQGKRHFDIGTYVWYMSSSITLNVG